MLIYGYKHYYVEGSLTTCSFSKTAYSRRHEFPPTEQKAIGYSNNSHAIVVPQTHLAWQVNYRTQGLSLVNTIGAFCSLVTLQHVLVL